MSPAERAVAESDLPEDGAFLPIGGSPCPPSGTQIDASRFAPVEVAVELSGPFTADQQPLE